MEILVAANALPWHHRDPADRFIIATARELKNDRGHGRQAFSALRHRRTDLNTGFEDRTDGMKEH
ncbi:MAG: hypothetical protein HOC74_01355 [Gemmatimonadetes bacterium]|nr:hypothetical protein [Gemmatimonadota bacterium]